MTTTQTISTATAPNGTEFTKVSLKGKHFGFAVIAHHKDSDAAKDDWALWTFHSKRAAAEASARKEQAWWTKEDRLGDYDDFTVVETTRS